MRRHGIAGREDLLVATCLRSPTRDRQIDGDLGAWLLRVANDGGALTTVRRAVIARARRGVRRRADAAQISEILARNAGPGDAAVVEAAWPRRAGVEARHDWAHGVTRMLVPLVTNGADGPNGSAWHPLLVRVYETSPCRTCRGTALVGLLRRDAAPDWMLRESLLDADEAVRSAARGALREQPRPRTAGA